MDSPKKNTVMLAPNGRPSNLVPELWHIVRTPAFRSFFGDWERLARVKIEDAGMDDVTLENISRGVSKVVDSNGEPLVCYHGTKNGTFHSFDESLLGTASGNDGHYGYGFYFSDDIVESRTYTHTDNEDIKSVFLNMKNPFMGAQLSYLSRYAEEFGFPKVNTAIDREWLAEKLKAADSVAYQLYMLIVENGYEKAWAKLIEMNGGSLPKSSIDLNEVSEWAMHTDPWSEDELPDWLVESIALIFDEQPKMLTNYPYTNQPRLLYYTDYGRNARYVTDMLKRDGYDGVIVGSEYVAFRANQIKLADGSNKTFDMNNNDIRYKEGGNVNQFDWKSRTSFHVLDNPFVEEPPSKLQVTKLKAFLSKHSDKYNPTYIKFYHGTAPNIPVTEEGLLPTSTNRRRSYQSTSGYVYLANTPQRAKLFGEMGNGGKCDVYEVIVRVLDLKADTDQLNNMRSVGNDIKDSVAESMVYGGGVRVKGNIPAWQIRKMEPVEYMEEGGEIKEIFEIENYLVDLSSQEHDVTAYFGNSETDARSAFDTATSDEFHKERGGTAILSKRTDRYQFIGELGEDETIDEFAIEDYYQDGNVYSLVEEGEWEEIDTRNVEAPLTEEEIERGAAQELGADVIAYCKKICWDYKTAAFMGSTFYGLKAYKDGNIMIRVADHYFNPSNVSLGKGIVWEDNKSINENLENKTANIYGFLSIVIRDSNSLKHRQSDFYGDIKSRIEDAEYKLVEYIAYKPNEYVENDAYNAPDFEADIDNYIENIESEIDRAFDNRMFEENEDGERIVDKELFAHGGTIESNALGNEMTKEIMKKQPAYLMTLEEYQKEVTPILQEYNKFIKKNEQYFVKSDYGGVFYYTYPELVDDLNSGSAKGFRFRKGEYDKGLSSEEYATKSFGYQKTGSFTNSYTPLQNPEGLVEKKAAYIEKLSKYFSEKEIVSQIDSDETKSNKRTVRRAIDDGIYKKLLEAGEVEISQLQKVAESVGVRLPKKIFDDATIKSQENKAKYDKVYALMPSVNMQVLSKMVDEIEASFKPLEKEIYDRLVANYEKIATKYIDAGEAEHTDIYGAIDFFDKLFSFDKKRRQGMRTDKNGKQHEFDESWYVGLKFKPDWKQQIHKYVLAFVEQLKVNMIYAIISNFEKITLPIKEITMVHLRKGVKGFEGAYWFIFENGSRFLFSTEAIEAGIHERIQRYHFRYISKFTDIVLADGTRGTNGIGIIENFSVKLDTIDPFMAIDNAATVEEVANAVYSCINSGGIRFSNAKNVAIQQHEKSVVVRFSPNQFGVVSHMYLTMAISDTIETNKLKAVSFLRQIGARKYKQEKFEKGGTVTQRKVPMDFDTQLDITWGDKVGDYIIVAHSTSSNLLPTIQKEGLKINSESVWQDSSKRKLFFEMEPTYTHYGQNVYGWKSCQMHGGEPVTLFVKVKKNDLKTDRDDAKLGERYRKNQKEYYMDVPPENIIGARFLMIDVKREDFTEFSKLFENERFEEGGTIEEPKTTVMQEEVLVPDNIDEYYGRIKRTYENGGQVDRVYSFETPTGEYTKLNYLQQVLVRSSEFSAWFGDWQKAANGFLADGRKNFDVHYKNVSKAIDMVTLEPMTVYHGSSADREFTEFDATRKLGIGRPYAYFADNIEYAKNFTAASQRGTGSVQLLYKAFVNIRNPFLAVGSDFEMRREAVSYWIGQISTRNYMKAHGVKIPKPDEIKGYIDATNSQILDYAKNISDRFPFWMLMARDSEKIFKLFLLVNGYDGVRYGEEFSMDYNAENPAEYTKAWTVFDASQVKLADGRNIDFDPFNKDIRYEQGGDVEPVKEEPKYYSRSQKLRGETGIEQEEMFDAGGYLVGKKNGKVIAHNDGSLGGVFVGQRHSEGGIDGVNTATGQRIEVETEELQVVGKAVNSEEQFEFQGKKMKPKEILSQLNVEGGGKAFEDGGEIVFEQGGAVENQNIDVENGAGNPIKYNGGEVILTRGAVSNAKKYDFNGESLTTRQIASKINVKYGGVAFEKGGNVEDSCGCSENSFKFGGQTLQNINSTSATLPTAEEEINYVDDLINRIYAR